MKLVDDWKKAWKWLTMWIASAGIVALEIYEQVQTYMPALKDSIPDAYLHRGMQVLLVLIILGRVIKQGESNAQPPTQ